MSPKNKGKFGKGKSEIEEEDEFISTMDRVARTLKPYVRQIIIGTVAVTVVAIALFSWQWYDARREAEATVVYEKALTYAQVTVIPDDPTDFESEEAPGKEPGALPDEDGDGIPDEYRSLPQRAEAVLVHLDALASDYGSTDVAAEARLLHAKMLYDAGRYDDAEKTYRAYLGDADSDDTRRIARSGLGYTLEAKGMASEDESARNDQLRQAQAVFKEIQSADEGPGKDLALYHEARILAVLGEKDQAIAALEKALEVAPESDIRYDINQRLVHLKAKPTE